MSDIKNFIVENSDRLDLIVLSCFSDDTDLALISRSKLKSWIEDGLVKVDGKVCTKAGQTVKEGQTVEIEVPEPFLPDAEAVEMPLDILYEDDTMLAINKPAGLSVHPGAGPFVPTLLNGLCYHFRDREMPTRCGIVHRLDKDTTGIVLVAKTDAMQSALSKMFAERTIHKTYYALVYTTPRAKRQVQMEKHGIIETRFGRHPNNWRLMAVLPEGGREAITEWERIEDFEYGALLSIKLHTGRTHQIRVHMDYIRSPLIGDPLYGDTAGLPVELKRAEKAFARQALHAAKVEFIHPITNQEMLIEAPLPADFEQLLEAFRRYA